MADSVSKKDLNSIHRAVFEIPQSYREDMRVPARIFVTENMLDDITTDRSLDQIVNVATLPGIVKAAMAMPDIHQGYGFPIGGVAATAIDDNGVISPGGIGYDINCGVRLLSVDISADDITPSLDAIANALFNAVPSGVGKGGNLKLSDDEIDTILTEGAPAMVKKGYGLPEDLEFCEEKGHMTEADASKVSQKAKDRGRDQLGTLGSGNHFLEVQMVEEIYDNTAAAVFGLKIGMVTVMIHCGSRGLGHQTCTDYVSKMLPNLDHWKIQLPDKELACAPFYSTQGQDYYLAMCAAANFAWANRHLIGHNVREAIQSILGKSTNVSTIYDVSHNIGKKEQHIIEGELIDLLVHRKGATRAFGPGRDEVPAQYRSVGHPVLIPGTMGTASYVLVGTTTGMEETFGSCCHGAGRRMSRMQAKKLIRGKELRKKLEDLNIIVKCDSDRGLAEEAPVAYKDVDSVVEAVELANIAKKVAKLKPIAVIKGG